ncbi:MAG TPA: four helix bundle protein [Candidatus Saccharimonadales bacterium]|nr:four helix bundle protein [Candidatus Saccharimonadales bacterium]
MSTSIKQLNIYLSARKLEDAVVTLAEALPEEQSYPLGDDLRRAATAVAHHIYQAHHYYSYGMKMEALHQARVEAEKTQSLLDSVEAGKFAKTSQLREDYTTVIKQSWGLIKYFKTRQAEKLAKSEVKAKEELAQAA